MGDRKQRLKGKANEAAGKTKGAVGYETGRGKTEAKGAGQALKGKGEVRAALVRGDGVYFIHDDRARAREHLSPRGARQKDVERFRRGDDDVRRLLAHAVAQEGAAHRLPTVDWCWRSKCAQRCLGRSWKW